MRPTRLGLAVLAAAVLTAAPARAVPYAGTARNDVASFAFTGADRRGWQLEVEIAYAAVPSTSTHRSVTLRLTQCDSHRRCTYSRQWQQPLAMNELSETPDGGVATVTTRAVGRSLRVTFTRGEGTDGYVWAGPTGSHAEYAQEWRVAAELAFSGVTCRSTDGYATERTSVDGKGAPFGGGPTPPRSLPKGFGSKPRCA